jgi:hypothetical protein
LSSIDDEQLIECIVDNEESFLADNSDSEDDLGSDINFDKTDEAAILELIGKDIEFARVSS